jgi:hypothetical protein
VTVALEAAYAAGVREAASPQELRTLLGPVARGEDVLEVPVGTGAPPAPLRVVHPGRVVLALGAQRLEATAVGETWDAERVLADAARLVAGAPDPSPPNEEPS